MTGAAASAAGLATSAAFWVTGAAASATGFATSATFCVTGAAASAAGFATSAACCVTGAAAWATGLTTSAAGAAGAAGCVGGGAAGCAGATCCTAVVAAPTASPATPGSAACAVPPRAPAVTNTASAPVSARRRPRLRAPYRAPRRRSGWPVSVRARGVRSAMRRSETAASGRSPATTGSSLPKWASQAAGVHAARTSRCLAALSCELRMRTGGRLLSGLRELHAKRRDRSSLPWASRSHTPDGAPDVGRQQSWISKIGIRPDGRPEVGHARTVPGRASCTVTGPHACSPASLCSSRRASPWREPREPTSCRARSRRRPRRRRRPRSRSRRRRRRSRRPPSPLPPRRSR